MDRGGVCPIQCLFNPSVLTHKIGHCLGLSDIYADEGPIMIAALDISKIKGVPPHEVKLTQDDIQEICKAWPCPEDNCTQTCIDDNDS